VVSVGPRLEGEDTIRDGPAVVEEDEQAHLTELVLGEHEEVEVSCAHGGLG
jgi:hypothetical protein